MENPFSFFFSLPVSSHALRPAGHGLGLRHERNDPDCLSPPSFYRKGRGPDAREFPDQDL